ncbi:MAG TPA: molybdopterin cofactor-binding domain-containing protein, partial [Acidimicrobiales bacterium]|nr:molybdopterin cofactor-binding domain-containing protein [Acidimicrobiales bacterium]
ARAFAAHGGLQCGFCIPGIVMRAKAQVDKKGAALAREDMARHLGAHLCRCTGYVKILDAIEAVARGEDARPVRPGGVGSAGMRYQAEELVLGERGYVDDIRVPGMLHAALRFTDHARADVIRVDKGAALAAPGVVAVYTAADIPGSLRVGIINKDWPVMIPEGGRTSYAGDVLAVVVAESRIEARAAAALVDVEYRELPPVVDPMAAIHSDQIAVWGTDSNVLSVSAYSRGDVEGALERSAHVVRETFETQRVEHAFLEPESTLAVPRPDGGIHVYSGGQGVWDDRNQIADCLAADRSLVSVELVSNGGAFGGKEDMSNQAHAALAAWLLRRPVKCTLSREESFLLHAKRHPIRLEYEAGCDEEGRLTAVRARLVGDSGAYASVGMKVLERAAGHATGPYRVPAVDVEAVAVRTNNPVCGAFRGFGANQAQFAMEGVMDRLAERVGVSALEIRRRNVIQPGQEWGPGQIMDEGCAGAARCLEALAGRYEEAAASGKAVGIGLGLKNSGLGNGYREITRAVVRFEPDGTVEVRHGWTEMGQGVHTVALQVAVEELGIDPERIRVVVDTSRELGDGQTTGSRGTLMGAGAVRAACQAARADGCRPGVDHCGEYVVDWTNHLGEVVNPTIHSAFGYAAQLVVMDPETERIERVVAAHDVGRAVNPMLCEGQVEGAVHMGLGYALTEDFPADERGFPVHHTLRALGILRAKDVPPIEVILVEVPQPRAPYGIKGVGEIGLVPTAGAVAAALHAADGQWRRRLPMRGDGPAGTGED